MLIFSYFSGLQQEIASQRETYDKRIDELVKQVQEMAAQSEQQVSKSDFQAVKDALETQLKNSQHENSER